MNEKVDHEKSGDLESTATHSPLSTPLQTPTSEAPPKGFLPQ